MKLSHIMNIILFNEFVKLIKIRDDIKEIQVIAQCFYLQEIDQKFEAILNKGVPCAKEFNKVVQEYEEWKDNNDYY